MRNFPIRTLQTSCLTALLFSLCAAWPARAQDDQPVQIIWDRTYGGTGWDGWSSVKAMPATDGGFIVAGGSHSNAGADKSEDSKGRHDFWILRVDSAGAPVWDKTYGGSEQENFINVLQTSEGGFLLAGTSYSDSSADRSTPTFSENDYDPDYWCIMLDKNGEKLWDRAYGGDQDDLMLATIALRSGDFVLAGYSASGAGNVKSEPKMGWSDFWIVRIDQNGEKVWDRTLGGPMSERCNDVVETAKGDLIVAGTSASVTGHDKSEGNRGEYDYWVVRLDSDGNVIWDKTFGGTEYDELIKIVPLKSGNLLLCGQSFSDARYEKSENSRGERDFWVVCIDENGNKLWDRTYGGINNEYFGSAIPTEDGGALLGGGSLSGLSDEKTEINRGSSGGVSSDFWIIRIDENGNIIWDKTLGSFGNDLLKGLSADGPNSFLLAGVSESDAGYEKTENHRGEGDFWVVKIHDFYSEVDGLTHVSPRKAAAPGETRLDFWGNGFGPETKLSLFREDQTLAPTRVQVVSPWKLSAWFAFAEADTGAWHARAILNDTLTDAVFNALRVGLPQPFAPWERVKLQL